MRRMCVMLVVRARLDIVTNIFFPVCGLADACVAECSGFVVDGVGTSRGHVHGALVTSVMMSFVVLFHR